MISLDTHPISELMKYTDSKEGVISLFGNAEKTRQAIESGAVAGVSFPEKKKKLHKGSKFKTPREVRVGRVNQINRLREKGMRAIEAAEACGVKYATYVAWSDNLGIKRSVRPLGLL